MSAIVFGSINMDLVTRVPRLPALGETLTGQSFEMIPGGKGANQAVAMARLGIATELVGRVGNDRFGQDLLAELRANRVTCDRVWVDQSIHSGVAAIVVDDAGENHIIVIPGANGQVGAADLERLQAVLPHAKVLLLQLEVPIEAVIRAAQAAKQAGVTVILDPAPAQLSLPTELYSWIDIITPNQVEASQLAGFSVEDHKSAARAATLIHQNGIATVIIKLGRLGVLYSTENGALSIPSFPVKAIDTVAAGDAFNGGLAAGLTANLSLQKAITFASAVAALSVTKAGAQPSLPTRQEVATFLSTHGELLDHRLAE
ncbi:ribokinase [Myxacorys almedinensis]|uniref:Ribokinase n=1 Tax=Myxacorys almedinensis A TaxID=2690445 RepID=A0A8J8CI72_9CYAN|nr:ribokinase [Myxacorys almedinensis]NDJ16176.1 ribokinase [Myxacorys almedinensis A]